MPEHSAAQAPITGVVLAGGLSSRLGSDKAALQLHCEGKALDLLARSADLLQHVCGKAIVVGRQADGHECYLDALPGNGPVGGIATALQITKTACLVLSCDLPFMEEALLERLLHAHEMRPAGTLSTAYRQQETGHVESLVAIYEAKALPLFERALRQKKLKISRIISLKQQHFLSYSTEEALPFFNINYPADLTVARIMMRMLGK